MSIGRMILVGFIGFIAFIVVCLWLPYILFGPSPVDVMKP